MSDTMFRGPVWGSAGTNAPYTAGLSGQQRVSDVHGRFMQEVLEGRVYMLSVGAGATTAYVGAAAGTPLLAVHNPAGSQKTACLLAVGWAARVGASAVGNSGLAAWSGPSVTPTGTRTNPTNARSLQAAGSSMLGFVNTALTGSTALTNVLPLLEYQMIGATPVSQAITPAFFDLGGLIVADPGNQFAIGMTVALTSLTNDCAIYWAEVPYQTAAQ